MLEQEAAQNVSPISMLCCTPFKKDKFQNIVLSMVMIFLIFAKAR